MAFNPLDLDSQSGYTKWREAKIRAYENCAHQHVISIEDEQVSENEVKSILSACAQFNYTIYKLQNPIFSSKQFVFDTGIQLGLRRLNGNLCSDTDNISSIQVDLSNNRRAGYIPYTDKKLTWHTDGYYNKDAETIRAMVLHCVRPAEVGGENLMLDHEMAYIQLRDEDPHFIRAFIEDDALTIPPNIENGIEIRAEKSGPVFSVDDVSLALHMRYSARTRNIQWKENMQTQEAVECMGELLNTNNPYIINYRMQAGEGIIANNVLHNRTAFTDSDVDDEKRLLYRARYYDRVHEVDS